MRFTGSVKPISLFYARTLHHVDRRVFQLSGGRATFSAWAAGMPVVMLETTGAKSGRVRALPVLAFPEGKGGPAVQEEQEGPEGAQGQDLFVVASNYGQDRHPAWYHNLKANPRARVTVDGVTREVEAIEVTDPEERERLYEQAGNAVVVFPAYRKRTEAIGRRIPVVRLRPATPSSSPATPPAAHPDAPPTTHPS